MSCLRALPFFFLFSAFLFLSPTAEAITCGDVTRYLAPCIPYVLRGGGIPPMCCNGVKGLHATIRFTAERRVACGCLKTITAAMAGINYGLVAGVPGKCGVQLPFAVAPSTDCNSIN